MLDVTKAIDYLISNQKASIAELRRKISNDLKSEKSVKFICLAFIERCQEVEWEVTTVQQVLDFIK